LRRLLLRGMGMGRFLVLVHLEEAGSFPGGLLMRLRYDAPGALPGNRDGWRIAARVWPTDSGWELRAPATRQELPLLAFRLIAGVATRARSGPLTGVVVIDHTQRRSHGR
jgi:hypothetical protein